MLEITMKKAVTTKLNQVNQHFYDLIRNLQDQDHPVTPLKRLDTMLDLKTT